MNLYDIVTPMTVDEAKATSQRLDATCRKNKHKEGTKIKGGVRVNNCVPNESIEEAGTRAGALNTAQQLYKEIQNSKGKPQHEIELLQRQLNALVRKYKLNQAEYTAGANQQQAGSQQQPPPPPGGGNSQQNANQSQQAAGSADWWQQQFNNQYEKYYGQSAQQQANQQQRQQQTRQQPPPPPPGANPGGAAGAYGPQAKFNFPNPGDPNWAQKHLDASDRMMQANQADMNKMMQAQMASGPWNMPGAKMAAEEVAEAQTDYQKRRQRERDIDAGKPVPKQRQSSMTDYQKRRAEQKRQEQLGENAWNDGTNDWTSEHDQWTKESAEPVTELKIDPRKAKPGQTQDEKYKGWNLRYQMRPTAGSKEYKGRADNLQSQKTQPIGPISAASAEELLQQLKDAIDSSRGSNAITTGRVTIFFNANLAKDVIGHGGDIYADIEKHGDTPLLLLSTEDQGGMIRAQDRSSVAVKGREGHIGAQAFAFPADKAKAAGLTLARYALGQPINYAPGVTAIPLEFRNEVYPGETVRMDEPGLTVSPPKMGQTMGEDGMIGPDSTSPVGGNTNEDRLSVGDPVIVTAPNAYEGKTGEISEFSPSGKFVIVNLYNHGEHSMHLSDVEYNQYADDEEEVDEGWQDFNKVEPYEVCLAGKPIKTFDYYEDARRFHDNWIAKLYREGDKAKADKITLNPIMKESTKVDPNAKFDYDAWSKSGKKPRKPGIAVRQLAQQTRDELAKKKPQGVAEASYINGQEQDPKSLRWKQTSMGYEEAVAKFGKNNVKHDGKNRLGQPIVMVLVPLGEQAETDYQKRRQRDRDVDAGKPVAKQRQSKMTDYQKRRAQQKKEMELGESTNYWTKLQNERNTKLNTLVNELKEITK